MSRMVNWGGVFFHLGLTVMALLFMSVPAESSQVVTVPYATVAKGWWSGLAITNTSSQAITPIVYITTSDGTSYCKTLESIKSGEIYAELI